MFEIIFDLNNLTAKAATMSEKSLGLLSIVSGWLIVAVVFHCVTPSDYLPMQIGSVAQTFLNVTLLVLGLLYSPQIVFGLITEAKFQLFKDSDRD